MACRLSWKSRDPWLENRVAWGGVLLFPFSRRLKSRLDRNSSPLNTAACSRNSNQCGRSPTFLACFQRFFVYLEVSLKLELHRTQSRNRIIAHLARLNLGEKGDWLLCFKVYFLCWTFIFDLLKGTACPSLKSCFNRRKSWVLHREWNSVRIVISVYYCDCVYIK